eukprot:gene4737-9405_t
MSLTFSQDSRFISLIQPIKDLAASWDIDIANSLDEYLNELEDIQMTMDTDLNFAEAALLIQGSATIYCRKVEYLYSMVFKALEAMTLRSSQTKEVSGSSRSSDVRKSDKLDWFDLGDDITPSYLNLDDISEGTNIEIPRRRESNQSSLTIKQQQHQDRLSRSNINSSRSSVGMMLSALQDEQSGKTPKISSSHINEHGALLIGVFGTTATTTTTTKIISTGSSAADAFHNHRSPYLSFDRHPVKEAAEVGMIAGGAYSDDDGDGDDGGGGCMEEEHNPPYEMMVDSPVKANNTLTLDKHSTPPPSISPVEVDHKTSNEKKESSNVRRSGAILSTVPSPVAGTVTGTMTGTAGSVVKSVRYDPFALLDPHQTGGISRPIRRGKAHIRPLPSGRRSVTASSSESSCSSHTLSAIGSIPLNGLMHRQMRRFFPPIHPILIKKDKLTDLRRSHGKGMNGKEGEDDRHHSEWMTTRRGKQGYDEGYGVCFHEDVTGRQQVVSAANENDHDHDDSDNEWDISPEEDDHEDGDMAFDPDVRGQYAVDTDRVVTWPIPSSNGINDDLPLVAMLGEGVNDVKGEGGAHPLAMNSYEDLCRQHIQSFMDDAQRYSRETQLSLRVREWTNRIEPRLAEQDARPPFDMHCYTDRVLSRVTSAVHKVPSLDISGEVSCDHTVDFAEVVPSGAPQYEVCRLFLACLQLTNQKNLGILPSPPPPITGDNNGHGHGHGHGNNDVGGMRLQLLSSVQTENIENYRAPSIASHNVK